MIRKLGSFLLMLGCVLALPGIAIGTLGARLEGTTNDDELIAREHELGRV